MRSVDAQHLHAAQRSAQFARCLELLRVFVHRPVDVILIVMSIFAPLLQSFNQTLLRFVTAACCALDQILDFIMSGEIEAFSCSTCRITV